MSEDEELFSEDELELLLELLSEDEELLLELEEGLEL